MKRSVIQLAGKTHVVSLPSKWVKKYNVKKGDELDVSEDSENLVISKNSLRAELKKEVDVSDYGTMARRVVGALYKKGYDEVKFHYEEPAVFEVLQAEIDSGLVGFEIVSHGKNHCVARMIASSNEESFDSIFRRIFFVLIGIGNDSIEFLMPLNREKLNIVILRDKTVNKLADYCRRVVNKSKDDNAVYLYNIAENLEKIGDEYRDMLKIIYENKIKVGKQTIELFKNVNSYFEMFYNLYYGFNPKGMAEFGERKNSIRNEIEKLMRKSSSDEITVLNYLDSIVKRTYDLNGVLLQVHL